MSLDKRYLKNKINEKGFTLIELIAVILVLAIIALIAIPFITKIVSEAGKEAFKQTTKGTANAIERQCDVDVINNVKIVDIYAVEKYAVTIGGDINVNARLPLYANANVDTKCNVQIAAHNDKWCATKAYAEDKVSIKKYVKGECRIGDTGPVLVTGNDTWGGWVNMTLYYPSGSTGREWRLGSQGELRYDDTLMWQSYLGSITIPLERVEDVWIKYILDGETIIIPPAGTVLVDIEPDSYGTSKLVSSVKVNITYDSSAIVKEYRVGNSGWMTYNGEFTVTENVIIEARAKKQDNVYNADGTLLVARTVIGRDSVYIGNIGINEIDLTAPTIERLAASNGSEVAKVKITYPVGAETKVYKLNYGVEETYTDEISIEKYGTYVIAYYYDADGKRSKSTSIYINNPSDPNDGSGGGGGPGTYDPPTGYPPLPPLDGTGYPPVTPTYRVLPPTITGTPTTLITGSVQVKVAAPVTADKIYIKKGNGTYQLYTGPITTYSNALFTAYYVTNDGEISEKAFYRVNNITELNKPYLTINADPYPYLVSNKNTSVSVSLDYSNATTIEYSENGIEYSAYTGAFTITKNKTIYARATNSYGTTTRQLNITNITGTPKLPDVLSVDITAAPEPVVSQTLTDKVKIKIEYDSRATKKYYSLTKNGALVEYSGEFEITSNTTIYAYAISDNGTGEDSKKIDNISNGIAEPSISGNPGNETTTSSTIITIDFDKNAIVKRYSINGGTLRDYTAPFEVTENSTIYAYNKNVAGQEASATYEVTNVLAKPTIFLIDKGFYYILKLNYPDISTGQEYKWTKDGTWKAYANKGILLIKPEYKDELLDEDDNFKVGIEDDSGNIVDFSNHWYLVETDFRALQENIFMRWDTTTPATPEIILNTLEPVKEVNATISYAKSIVEKEYKLVDASGNIVKDWTAYTGVLTISSNNTTIYARGMDESEVYSDIGILKVTNIDENQPVIKLTMDLVAATRKLGIKVSVTDDVLVSKVKWAKGILGESYFATGGTEILNNTIVNITENSYYTFYAEDGVGNKQAYTINVENIDLTPPIISISATPEDVVGTTSQVAIDYGDSTTKQYKIGSSTTWLTYSAAFNVSSYTVLTNNWENADGTVTIFAKGLDGVGNEVIVSEKLLNLDVDMPATPVIKASAGYPILTLTGIKFDDVTTITYDNRTDIDNYYSLDGGLTWLPYTGTIHLSSGTIQAKSIKKNTGLTVTISKNITLPSDALNMNAYDGKENTYVFNNGNTLYMNVDPTVWNHNVEILWQKHLYMTFTFQYIDENNVVLGGVSCGNGGCSGTNMQINRTSYIVPTGTTRIKYYSTCNNGDPNTLLYEMRVVDEPVFSATNGYMLLHADPTRSIKKPYQMINISYYPTSVQRLYSLDNGITWLEYQDTAIWLNQGAKILAKGIDINGNESKKISSYTANSTNALGSAAFDGNEGTYILNNGGTFYMDVDPSIWEKSIQVIWQKHLYATYTFQFLNDSSTVLGGVTCGSSGCGGTNMQINRTTYTVPTGTTRIKYYSTLNNGDPNTLLYEIHVVNEPIISATNGYMLLHAEVAKRIKKPYQMISIAYFPTSVQRLYSLDNGVTWLEYQDRAIWLDQGAKILAKGIDKYGIQTRVVTSYTANATDALAVAAFDGSEATYILNNGLTFYMSVDPSVWGKSIQVVWKKHLYTTYTFQFLNDSNTVLGGVTCGSSGCGGTNGQLNRTTYTVPTGTTKIKYYSTLYNGDPNTLLYEIIPIGF